MLILRLEARPGLLILHVKHLDCCLQDLFSAYDTDRSGSISFEELTDGLKRHGYVVTESEVRQLMEKMDMDHDGNVGGVEFLATLIDWQQVRLGCCAHLDLEMYITYVYSRSYPA